MKSLFKNRNPWPLAIVGFFIVFFAFLTSFIVFATHQHEDLVRPDYYEHELKFQTQLDSARRTGQISDRVAITYNAANRNIELTLPQQPVAYSAGEVTLYRPSDSRLDQRMPLAIDAKGTQRIDARNLQAGLWKVRVQWVADGEQYYFDHPVVIPSVAGRS